MRSFAALLALLVSFVGQPAHAEIPASLGLALIPSHFDALNLIDWKVGDTAN